MKLKTHEIQPSGDVLTDDELEEVFNQLNHMISKETIRSLLQSKTSFTFSNKQIQHIEKMRRNVLYKDKNQSPASKLLEQLENDTKILYTYVTADVGNENLISIRQKKKGRPATILPNNNIHLQHDKNMGTFAERGR